MRAHAPSHIFFSLQIIQLIIFIFFALQIIQLIILK